MTFDGSADTIELRRSALLSSYRAAADAIVECCGRDAVPWAMCDACKAIDNARWGVSGEIDAIDSALKAARWMGR